MKSLSSGLLSRSRLLRDSGTSTDPIAEPSCGCDAPRRRMATCPECDADVEVDEFDVDKGDQISCPECGSNLEVTGLSPIELDLAAEDDEEDADAGELTDEVDGEDEDDEEEK